MLLRDYLFAVNVALNGELTSTNRTDINTIEALCVGISLLLIIFVTLKGIFI